MCKTVEDGTCYIDNDVRHYTEDNKCNIDKDAGDYWRWYMYFWQCCERLLKTINVFLTMLWETVEDDTCIIYNDVLGD